MSPAPSYQEQHEQLAIDSELRSLFQLLDDPDMRIAQAVEERLLERGPSILSAVAHFAKATDIPLAKSRAERIAISCNTEILAKEFEALAERLASGDRNALEDGVFLIARFGNPDLDVPALREELLDFAVMLNDRLSGLTSALEVLNEVNHFFFDELRFRGNQLRFLEAENCYIDQVIERRVGIPISLAVVYLLVAQYRLRLPFAGASAPGHFLIRYEGLRSEPLFVDAFNGGVVLRERDIKRYLDTSGLPFNKSFLEPAEPRSILLRIIRNLIIVFNEQGNPLARAAFERFMHILAPAGEGQSFLRGLES